MLTEDDILGIIGDMASSWWVGVKSGNLYPPTVEELWKVLCSHGVHDYEFIVINPKGALLRCFYCGHEKISTKMWMKR